MEKKLNANGAATDEDNLATCTHIFDLAETLSKNTNDGTEVTYNYQFIARLALLVRLCCFVILIRYSPLPKRDVYWRIDNGSKYWNKVDDVLEQLRDKYRDNGSELGK